jgi:uncharacterized protein (DUF433 family)
MNTAANDYPYLEHRPGSSYRQLFVKGTRIRAEVVYRRTVPIGEDGYFETPEQVAADFNIPAEAVRDAVRYCESNPIEIAFDHRTEDLISEAAGENDPDYRTNPAKHRRRLTPDEYRRIEQQAERELGMR